MQDIPISQTSEAVKVLITYDNHGTAPAEMPDFYRMGESMVLVQSRDKLAYYTVTPKSCSCPAAHWNRGPCKHMRKFFPAQDTTQRQSIAATLEEHDANLGRMPYRYRRMVQAAREEGESGMSELLQDQKPFKPFRED